MTKTVKFPNTEQLRKEESLRLHAALAHHEPGSDMYTKILSQISALEAHVRALEIKEAEFHNTMETERLKQACNSGIESDKAAAAAALEQQKAAAAHAQKQWDLAGKLITVGAILIFEHSGHAIISKAFGLIRD